MGRDQELADAILGPAWAEAVASCRADPELAGRVSRGAADELTTRAANDRLARRTEKVHWLTAQRPFVELARIAGADETALAQALLFSVTQQSTAGIKSCELSEEAVLWLLRTAPRQVELIVRDPGAAWRESEHGIIDTHLIAGLSRLRGEIGAEWFVKMHPEHQSQAQFEFHAMALGRARPWDPDDWNLRLHGICDAAPERPGFLLLFGAADPPPESAVAQVRLACTYSEGRTDHLLRSVAENLRGYLSGDPRLDQALIWWQGAEVAPATLLWLLELLGPPGVRADLIEAALAAGALTPEAASPLTTEVERPEWADGEVAWEIVEIVEAGTVRLPDGELAGGDPWWSFEGVPWALKVEPGAYPVRVVIGHHPLQGDQCVAAELILDDHEVATWEHLETTDPHAEGYLVEVGVGSFGAAKLLCPGIDMERHQDFLGESGAVSEVDEGERGSLVMFSVGPQHQDCRTWLGRADNGNPVRLVTDLGILEVNPSKRPLPW